MMASREHRLHHWLWHEVRNSWLQYDRDLQAQIRDLGWEPPRPAMDANNRPILTNSAGEDFLYMHRQMIWDVNALLRSVGDPNYPRVRGWLFPPPPDDPDYPVPPAWFNPATQDGLPFGLLSGVKADIFYYKRMMMWHRLYTNFDWLRGMSLGVLGTLIEQTIHNAMHLRWCSNPAGVRPDPLPTDIAGKAIPEVWDDPRYDFLGDTWSSHVHPIFWRLHGWIDDRIEDWKLANGIFRDDFWKGTWVGPTPGDTDGSSTGHHRAVDMEDLDGGGVHLRLEQRELAEPHTGNAEQVAAVVALSGTFHQPFVQTSEDWLRSA